MYGNIHFYRKYISLIGSTRLIDFSPLCELVCAVSAMHFDMNSLLLLLEVSERRKKNWNEHHTSVYGCCVCRIKVMHIALPIK